MVRSVGVPGAQVFLSSQLEQKRKSHSRDKVPTLLFILELETDRTDFPFNTAFPNKTFPVHISAISLSESLFVFVVEN